MWFGMWSYLAFIVDSGGASQVRLVVRLLQRGQGRLVSEHCEAGRECMTPRGRGFTAASRLNKDELATALLASENSWLQGLTEYVTVDIAVSYGESKQPDKQWVVVAGEVDRTNVLAKNPHEEALQVQLAQLLFTSDVPTLIAETLERTGRLLPSGVPCKDMRLGRRSWGSKIAYARAEYLQTW